MSRHTEIVPKNLLSGSENSWVQQKPSNILSRSKKPQVQQKPCIKLWFPSKSSPGHQYIETQRKCPQKHTQPVENPWYHQNRATDHDLWRHSLLKLPGTGKTEKQTMISVKINSWSSTCRGPPKQTPKTYSAGRKTARYCKTQQPTMISIKIFSWTSTSRGTPK